MIKFTASNKTAADILEDFVARGTGMINKGFTVKWAMDILSKDPETQAIDISELEETLYNYYWN